LRRICRFSLIFSYFGIKIFQLDSSSPTMMH
jgi:hypothetical protein